MGYTKQVVVVAVLVQAAISSAGPTSLNFMPISDVLMHREVYVEYSSMCLEHHVDSSSYHCGALEMGLFDRLEFGIDLGLDPKCHAIWNAKVKLGETKDGKVALSAGLWNCDDDYVEPFAVGSYSLGWSRLHIGVTHDDATKLMAGADGPICQDFYWMADYMSGSSEQMWFGVGFNHPNIKGLGISFSIGLPLRSEQGWQGMAAIGYVHKF